MRWARPAAAAVLLVVPALLAGCGGSASSASGDDPVKVTAAYLSAVKTSETGGQDLLESESTEKLSGSTSLSRYLAANKSATAEIATMSWIPPGGTNPVSTQKECLIGQPAPGQICIVTVKVTGGKGSPVYFHVNLENRYTGKWQIINVDAVDKTPDNLLPTGNQAHLA